MDLTKIKVARERKEKSEELYPNWKPKEIKEVGITQIGDGEYILEGIDEADVLMDEELMQRFDRKVAIKKTAEGDNRMAGIFK